MRQQHSMSEGILMYSNRLSRKLRRNPASRGTEHIHRRRRRLAAEILEDRRLLANVELLGVPVWQEQGPIGILGGGADVSQGRVSGAVQAIAVHPDNPNIAYVGSVNGGIWRTDDLLFPDPISGEIEWQPLTDQFPSLSITSLAFSELDPQTIYAGTGRTSSFQRAGTTAGPMKTTDGGSTWSLLDEDQRTFSSWNVTTVLPTTVDLRADHEVLLVTTHAYPTDTGQLLLSTDGGKSYQVVGDTNDDDVLDGTEERLNIPQRAASDLIADPANSPVSDHVFYAAIPQLGVFRGEYDTNDPARADDDTVQFTQVLGQDMDGQVLPNSRSLNVDFSETSNIKLATQQVQRDGQSHTLLYAGLVTGDYGKTGRLKAVVRSDDSGATWQRLGIAPNVHPGNQGDLHFSLAADPNIEGVVYVGGDRHPNQSVKGGILYRWQGDWEQIVFRGANDTTPHADSRDIVFDRFGNLLQADDGGLFRLFDPNNQTTRRWESLSGTLAVTEQVSVAYDTLNDVLISGNQDNGVTEQDGLLVRTEWNEIFGGDGEVQQVVIEGEQSIRYSMSNNFQFFRRRTFDDTNTQQGSTETVRLARPGGALQSGLQPKDRNFDGAATIPYVLNATDPSRMLIGYHGLYEATDRGDKLPRSGVLQNQRVSDDAGTITALVYGWKDPNADDPDKRTEHPEQLIYAARRDALYVREPGGQLEERSPQLPTWAGDIRDIVVDPTNWKVAYVISESQIWRTDDAGQNWSLIGNGRNEGFRGLRTVALAATEIDGQQHNVVLVGADQGVFRAIEGGQWKWTEFGRGLPNAPVMDLRYYSSAEAGSGGKLVVATLGRGTWTIEGVDSQLSQLGKLIINGDDQGNDMAVTRDGHNPSVMKVFMSSAEYVFDESGLGVPIQQGIDASEFVPVPVASLSKIEVHAGAGNDTFRVSSTHGVLAGSSMLQIDFYGGPGLEDKLRLRSESSGKPDEVAVDEIEEQDRASLWVRGDYLNQPKVQLVRTFGVETHSLEENVVPHAQVDAVSTLATGLQDTATLAATGLFGENLAVIGGSLGQALDGVRFNEPAQKADPLSLSSQIQRSPGDGGDTLFRRMIETGDNAFRIADIGTQISTFEQLRDRLDALDDIPNNVILNPTGTPEETSLLDVRIVDKPISGTADFGVGSQVFGGDLQLAGLANITADVTMHIRFGVDGQGFFIDPEDNPDPEFNVRNIRIDGDLKARGRLGIVEVDLDDAVLEYDPGIVVAINLHDPGSGIADDGRIRLADLDTLLDMAIEDVTRVVLLGELGEINNSLYSAELSGTGSGHDVTLRATISPAPLYPGIDLGFTELAGAQLSMIWPDAEKPTELVVDVTDANAAGRSLLTLLDLSMEQLMGGLNQFTTSIQAASNLGPFNFEIAFDGGELGDIFSLPADDLVFDNDTGSLLQISNVYEEDGFQKFEVLVDDFSFSAHGVAVGSDIHYRPLGDGELVVGTIETVDAGLIVVRYADHPEEEQRPDRDNPLLQIARSGGLTSRIRAMLGNLGDAEFLSTSASTIQDFIYEFFTSNGLGLEQAIAEGSLSVDYIGGLEPAIEFTIPFDLEPMTYRQPLDFGGAIQGASFGSDLALDFTVDPNVQLTFGLRLPSELPAGPDNVFAELPLHDRFYVSEQSQVSFDIEASWDGEEVAGSIGFLDATLAGNTPEAPGVSFSADVGLRFHATTGDGRIYLRDFGFDPTAPLEPYFEDARFDLDFKVTPNVGDNDGLQPLILSVSQPIVDPEPDFLTLVAYVAQESADYVRFDNLSPEMILRALPMLAEKLTNLGVGSVLDTKLPLIGMSLTDLADIGAAFSQDLDDLDLSQAQTASVLANFLGATEVTVRPDHILFQFNVNDTFNHSIDNLSLGVGEQLGLGIELENAIDFSATASANLVLGFSTLPDIPLEERIFLSTDSEGTRLNLRAEVDLGGYDLGGGDNPPLNLTVSVMGPSFSAPGVHGYAGIAVEGVLHDDNGQLSLQEIADGAFEIEVRLDETDPLDQIQAFIPLDGDGGGVEVGNPFDPAPLDGSGDAVVEVAGRLSSLLTGGALVLSADEPPLHINANVEDLLSDQQLDDLGGQIIVNAHNLDEDFIGAGLLSFDSLWSGLEQFVDFAEDLLGTNVLDFELPIIGASLRDGLNFVGEVKAPDSGLPATLGELVWWLADQDLTGDISEQRDLLQDALDELADETDILSDIMITLEGDEDDPDSIAVQFAFTPDLSIPLLGEDGFDFDLGVDFLSLTGQNVNITVGGQLHLLVGFGIDREQGFFIKTDFVDPVTGEDVAEIQIEPRITLNGETILTLGFVEVAATFDQDDFLGVNFSANFDGGTDGRWTMGELISGDALSQLLDDDALEFSFEAQLNTPLEANVKVDGVTFPLVTTNLEFAWNDHSDPMIELQQITIPAGRIVDTIGGDVLDAIRENNPLGPILDVLGEPLPIIDLSILDILKQNSAIEENFIFKLLVAIESIDGIGDPEDPRFNLPLGDVLVARSPDATPIVAGGVPTPPPVPGTGISDTIDGILIPLAQDYGLTFPILDVGSLFNFFVAEKDVDLVRFVPPTPLEIYVGYGGSQHLASLSFYGIAEVSADASFTVGIGLDADISFGLDTRGLRERDDERYGFLDGIWIGDFDEGLDGQIDPGDFDLAEVALRGGVEASVSGTASVLGFDFARLRGFGNITAEVGINLNDDNSNHGLVDIPDAVRSLEDRTDGKFHLDEIAKVLEDHGNNPLCLFDLTGAVRAALGADIKIDLGILGDIDEGFEVDTPLVEFEVACPAILPPDLLAQLNDTELVLTWADGLDEDVFHTTAATNHPDGDVIEISRVIKEGAPTLRIKKGSVIEDFGPMEPERSNNYIDNINRITLIRTPIEGTMGNGPDRIIVDPQINTPVKFYGGDGDDYLVAGLGGGILIGGEGDDTLINEIAFDTLNFLIGGGGDDVLRGGLSHETLVGDYDLLHDPRPETNALEGSDTIYAGGSADVDFVWGDNQGDDLDEQGNGEGDGESPESNRPTGDDIFTGLAMAVVYGGAGDDTVQIHPLGSGIVYGGTGNDHLTGGTLNDILVGQAGDDTLTGGEGEDQLFGGNFRELPDGRSPGVFTEDGLIFLGNDRLFGNGGNDFLDGYDSTFVVAYGHEGDDTIVGSVGSDNLYGGDDNDTIVAGPGNDLVRGGTGDDAILGGAGSIDNQTLFVTQTSGDDIDATDRLFGDDGDDVILGDNGTIRDVTFTGFQDIGQGLWDYRIVTRTFTDPFQGGGIDVIVGGKGDDQLFGGAGGDFIVGDSDYLYFQGVIPALNIDLNPGDDTIIGDQGTIELNQYRFRDHSLSAAIDTTITEDTYIIRSDIASAFVDPGADKVLADELHLLSPGGDDLVFGGEDADLIRASAGEDIVFGDLAESYDYDYHYAKYFESTFVVEEEHKYYITTIEEERGGDDLIHGGSDSDIVIGGFGNDELEGNEGQDFLFGDHATIDYGDQVDEPKLISATFITIGGDDRLNGGSGDDVVLGGFGNDELVEEGGGVNILFGDSGEVFFVNDGSGILSVVSYLLSDQEWALGGDDNFVGSEGHDYVAGGPGDDVVLGGDGDDVIFGDLADFHYYPSDSPAYVEFVGLLPDLGGNDLLYGEAGFDRIEAGAGNDLLSGGPDLNILIGAMGTDTVVEQADVNFLLLDGVLFFGEAQDGLVEIEKAHLTGGDSDNLINASEFSGMTTLIGGRGNDELLGGVNEDRLLGGDDSDRLFGGQGDDLLIGGDVIEELSLEDRDDELHGGEGDDTLLGQQGDDFLDGGAGHDRIDGGEGDNTHLALWHTSIVPDGLYHTFTVDQTSESLGGGSLRWAMEQAETLEGSELAVVDFQIPLDDPHFIDADYAMGGDPDPDAYWMQVSSELPSLQRGNVVINGLSQGGFVTELLRFDEEPNPAGPEIILDGRSLLTNGFEIDSDHNSIFGLTIQQFAQNGILIRGDENTVSSNFIGTDPTGSIGMGNGATGVLVQNRSRNRLDNNLLSGNGFYGALILGTSAADNLIAGNKIGTDASGTAAIGNGVGIGVLRAPDNGFVGNLISGNEVGVDIRDATALGNTFVINQIGTTIDGVPMLGNAEGGVIVHEAPGNLFTRNQIAGNQGYGISVQGDGAIGNEIRANTIYSNSGLGIDLGAPGVNANDALDADTGPNNLQNYPAIEFAASGANTQIAGILQSMPRKSYRIEFFASQQLDITTFGQGERFLGSVDITTDSSGEGVFNATLIAATTSSEWITATATAYDTLDTSEFSAGIQADQAVGTYEVTNTRDSGPGSLRTALEFLNGIGQPTPGPGSPLELVFNIPVTDPNFIDVDSHLPGGDAEPDVFVISTTSVLPALTRGNIVIDGATQHNFTGDTNPLGPEIVLAGNLAGAGIDGLTLASSGNAVHGLNIQQFDGSGILITSDSNTLTGNYIGTDATGLEKRPNVNGVEVRLAATDNRIGGTSAAERNVISGNSRVGIQLASSFSEADTFNYVQGNYIGTDATGEAALGNTAAGVYLVSDHNTVIGGIEPGAGNVISGNGPYGIWMYGGNTTKNVRVQGNFIGTNADGTAAIPNWRGIGLVGNVPNSVDSILIGGTQPGAGNVISGNSMVGIEIVGPQATNVQIEGNKIGTDIDGLAAIGNGTGVLIIGAADNFFRSNVISGNVGTGIDIRGNTATGNTLQRNSIYDNGGLGIDLGGDGLTLNDFGDVDAGPNGLQNSPVLRAAAFGESTRVWGSLQSTPGQEIAVDFYANSQRDPSGYGEGRRWLGDAVVTTDATGLVEFDVELDASTFAGEQIAATATDALGNTSEFSGSFVATGLGSLITGGGPDDDTIVLSTIVVDGQTQIAVNVNGVDVGRYHVDGTIYIDSGAGDDTIIFDASITINAVISSGPGNDFIQSGGGNDTIDAGEGDDTILAGGGDDVIDGGAGNDQVDGQAGRDTVTTGNGRDVVSTDSDDDLGDFGFQVVAPISISNESSAVRGQPLTLAAQFPDPVSIVSIDFGDSHSIDAASATHAFAETGTYQATLTVIDAAGNTTTIHRAVPITETAMQVDPADEDLTALAVGGSIGDDRITIHRAWFHNGDVRVWNRWRSLGTFSPTGHLLVYGQLGDDRLTVGPFITQPAWLFGGDGNDRLSGGLGDDVLDGGEGNDRLYGNFGRDLLIGGGGRDRLYAGHGDDLLIAGSLSVANRHQALTAIMAEWTSGRTLDDRVSNLLGDETGSQFPNRANSNTFLTTAGESPTVVDDGERDLLSGSLGRDWIFANLQEDRLVGSRSGDITSKLGEG